MEKLVSRKEAAEMLQVTNQTISNYAKRGLLTEVKKGPRGFLFYYEHQVIALMDDVKEIADLEQKIQAYKDELLETKKQFETLKDEWEKKLHTAQRSSKIYDVAIALLRRCTFDTELPIREKVVIDRLLDLQTTDEIGEELNISKERVRQIFCKSVRRLKGMRSYNDVINTNKALLAENAELKNAVKLLKASINTDNTEMVISGDDKVLFDYPILRTPVSAFNLSVRAYNCLKSADITVLADLVSYKKYEFMRFRNFGRKTLNEIENLLTKHGLTFGMIEHRRKVY